MSALKLFFTGLIFSVNSLFGAHPNSVLPVSPAPHVEVRASSTQAHVSDPEVNIISSSTPKTAPKKAVSKTVAKPAIPAKESIIKINAVTSTSSVSSSSSSAAAVVTSHEAAPVQNSSPASAQGGGTSSSNPSQEAQDACGQLDEGVSCQVGQMIGTCQARGEYFACFSN